MLHCTIGLHFVILLYHWKSIKIFKGEKMVRKLLKATFVASVVTATSLSAGGFAEFYERFGDVEVNQGYGVTNPKLNDRIKELGYYATPQEVKDALSGALVDGKPVVIVDSRTRAEQEGLHLQGAILANLRGWNRAFDDERFHSDNIGGVYSYCRTGTDQADDIVRLQWLFQGKAKTFGIRDMVQECYPTVSISGNVLDASLNANDVYVQEGDDGRYYEINCPQVQNSCAPIAVFNQQDIETAELLGDELPRKLHVENSNIGKDTTIYRGADNYYYKANCWDHVVSK